jgi:hypothetical protein
MLNELKEANETRYEATDEERLALKTFVKLVRSCESVVGRTLGSITDAGLTPSQFAVLEGHRGESLEDQRQHHHGD